jgi:serine/threonine-protein kinase
MSGIPAGAGSLLGKRLGKYEILALLALGGTAEIYLARIDGTNGFEKYVVVKCLHDHLADDTEFVKMFLDEARLAAVLDHSNIVQTFELGEHEHRYYMVMEFLAGLSLAMVVRRAAERVPGGRMPVPLILNAAAQAAAGLHYAHERTQGGKPLNMVHRDISPQNLVIGFEGVVKVVDFGIARAEYRETKTKAGTIKGKFAYMSPEQCVATNVDRRTDVFALGVIVHELMTGRRLFKRNSPYETYQAVIDCAVPPPSTVNVELDPALDKIIMKAVAKDKENRYATAEEFGDAMLGYLHHRGKGSGPGEIGRWFDEHFQQEIEEHGERMRELISGREDSIDMGWEEAADAKKSETVPFRKGKDDDEDAELDLQSGDVQMVRPSEASLEHLVSRLNTESEQDGRDDDGGQPPEKTRIEANPLEIVQALEAAAAAQKSTSRALPGEAALPKGSAGLSTSRALPGEAALPKGSAGLSTSRARPGEAALPNGSAGLSTPVPVGSVTGGPAPLPAPPSAPKPKPLVSGRTPSGGVRFPDAGQLPTVVAKDTKKTPAPVKSEAAYKATVVHEAQRPPDAAQAPTMAAPPIDPNHGALPSMTLEHVERIGSQSATHDSVKLTPAQLAMLDSPGLPARPRADAPTQPPPANPHVQEGSYNESPYPVVSGRPMSTDIAPSTRPSYAAVPRTGPQQPNGQQAANLMSPVGEHYPQRDWDAAAAAPAKALTRIQLGLLFVAVVAGALTLTMIVAKIFH